MWVSQASAGLAQEAAPAPAAVPTDSGPVLLLEPAGRSEQSGLLLALRIQLGDRVPVEPRPLPEGLVDREARTRVGEQVLAAEHPRAVVWTEAPTPYSGFTVCVLRAGPEGAPPRLEVREVSGLEGPDLDRTIALEVSEILDQTAASSNPPQSAQPRPGSVVPPAVPPEGRLEPEDAPGWRVGFVGQVGAAAAPFGGTGYGRWGPMVAGGVGLETARVRYAALAEATWMLPAERTTGTAVVEVRELDPALRLSGSAPLGGLWLGAYTALALSLVEAEARNERTTGEKTELVPSWLLGASAELPLSPWVGLRVDVGAQVRLRRQRFSVDEVEVADSGKVRPIARLALSFRPFP